MGDDIREAKRRVKGRFLGKHGVHAVGVRGAEKCVAVYVDRDAPDPPAEVLAQLRQAAAPYGVAVVREGRPSVRG